MEKFLTFCRHTIIETLSTMINENRQVCGIELVDHLVKRIKADCEESCSDYEAKIYLIGWWDAVSHIYDYQVNLYGRVLYNPFKEQKDFYLQMVSEGIDNLLFQCDMIREHWDSPFYLDEKSITSLINNIKDIEEFNFTHNISTELISAHGYSA